MRAGPKGLSKAAVRRKNGGSIWNVVRWLMMVGICYVILYPPLIKLSVALMSPGRQATKNGLFICVLRQLPAHLPVEMEEAAFVAGAGVDRTSWGVMTPNAVPVLVTAGVPSFVGTWNDLYTASTHMSGMPLFSTLLNTLSFSISPSAGGVPAIDTIRLSMLTNAGALLITAQLLALFLLAQRFFAQGVERAGRTGMSRSLTEAFLTDRCNICCILHTNFALMKRLNIGYNLYDRAAQRQTTWQEGSVIKKTLLAIVGLMPAVCFSPPTPAGKRRKGARNMKRMLVWLALVALTLSVCTAAAEGRSNMIRAAGM